MRLNELYKKQSLDKTLFDSGDKVVDISTDHNGIGTVLSFDGKVYRVKFTNSDGSHTIAFRNSDELRLARKDELK